MAHSSSPEKGTLIPKGPEAALGKVEQPSRQITIEGLAQFVEAVNKISERTGEDRSAGDAASGSGPMVRTAATQTASARDLAIANLPAPEIMQKQLKEHIQQEVKRLHKQARQVARLGSPGAAYHLNKLYARIRQFKALLSELLEASYDVVRRFFIRVFVDKQAIL